MYSRPRRPDERFDARREAPSPEPDPRARLLALQRGAGNAAVARMLSTAPAQTIARTAIVWGSNDLARLLHIMPWKHGWDELIEPDLAMVDDTGKLRSEDHTQLKEDEKGTLKADYEKVKVWLRYALENRTERTRKGTNKDGQFWEFKAIVPKAQTLRKQVDFEIVVKGFRPYAPGTTEPTDRFVIGDAWVDTDRQEYLKGHGWNATGYQAPQGAEPVAVGGEDEGVQ